jgi:hypothetical protein
MRDMRPIEIRSPKTVESVMADLYYREQVANEIDIQIVFTNELMKDICARLLVLDRHTHD